MKEQGMTPGQNRVLKSLRLFTDECVRTTEHLNELRFLIDYEALRKAEDVLFEVDVEGRNDAELTVGKWLAGKQRKRF